MKSPLITIKAVNSTGTVQSLRSRKIKRIYHFIQMAKNTDCVFELHVTYYPGTTNEGVYKNKNQLTNALRAFTEKN